MDTSGVLLPFNLWTDANVVIDMYDFDNINTQVYTKEVFDDSYWSKYGRTLSMQTWFPYFSSCKGYDRRIQLFDILEQEKYCNLKDELEIVLPDIMTN